MLKKLHYQLKYLLSFQKLKADYGQNNSHKRIVIEMNLIGSAIKNIFGEIYYKNHE